MKLNLSYNYKLDPEIALIFNNLAIELRTPFTQTITKISDTIGADLDWWVEGPSSRNTIGSPLFYYYCCFNLVDRLIKKEYDISEILVDSIALKNILNKYIEINGKDITVLYNRNLFASIIKKIMLPFNKIPKLIYDHLYTYFCAKRTKPLQNKLPKNDIILIDIFAFPGFFVKDRYYNGLIDQLSSSDKELVFFVPTIVMTPKNKINLAFNKMRLSNRNYLIKEDYLKIYDILYAIGHYFRALRIKINPIRILEVDISSLIKEEIISMKGMNNAVVALLNYRFAKRLKESNIKLKLVIDWFENQVIDKGWNAGFNKFYPEVKSVGYSGQFPSQNYLCSFPTSCEKNNGLLPSEIAVVGKGLLKSVKEFCPNLNVKTAPSFRFSYIWENNKYMNDRDYSTVLVTLCQISKINIGILKIVKECLKNYQLDNIKFLIKAHPSMTDKHLKKIINYKSSKNLLFVTGNAEKYLLRSDILISGMSSICIEAIALGVPVIEIENTSGLSYNSIPKEVPKQLNRSCRTSNEVIEAINYFRNRTLDQIRRDNLLCLDMKMNFFEPITKENVYNFLDLNN